MTTRHGAAPVERLISMEGTHTSLAHPHRGTARILVGALLALVLVSGVGLLCLVVVNTPYKLSLYHLVQHMRHFIQGLPL